MSTTNSTDTIGIEITNKGELSTNGHRVTSEIQGIAKLLLSTLVPNKWT
jgi:hypothetical protein